jgi:hypothetical protein
MLISQLILAPVLIFEAWFYLEVVRRSDERGAGAFDAAVIVAATLACLALLPRVAAHDSGGNDRIWHPVLSVLSTFFTFPAVLLAGLALRAAGREHV